MEDEEEKLASYADLKYNSSKAKKIPMEVFQAYFSREKGALLKAR